MARNWDTSIISKKITAISSSLVMSCLASQVFASGFAILEQNVTNLGLAYSGTAALAEDASTGYYNPAGLTRLDQSEIVLSGIIIQGDFDLDVSTAIASFNQNSVLAPAFVPGDPHDNGGTVSFVPAFYVTKRIDERWVFGFFVNMPFGLDTEYQEDGIARYLATISSIKTLNFSPNIAYEFLPCLSFGIGPDALWGRADLEAHVGSGNASQDGFQKNIATGWGYGWHFGVLWSPMCGTRIGLNYRSHINFHAEGYSENLVPYTDTGLGIIGFGLAEGTYSIQRVRAEPTFPESWTLSLYQAFNDCLALTADFAWTNWSRFHTLKLRFEPGASIPIVTNISIDGIIIPLIIGTTPGLDTDTAEHFKDTRRVAVGLIYNYDANWLFRVGAAFDQSPIRDEFRTARLPDSDRIWVAVGGAFSVNEAVQIDFGYAHIFFDDSDINEQAPFIAPSSGNPIFVSSNPRINRAQLIGDYESKANIFGVQIRYNFV